MSLEVTALNIECHNDGSSKVSVWCRCRTSDEIEDVIVWLKLAKALMERWESHIGIERA